jgi:hypothetical protein
MSQKNHAELCNLHVIQQTKFRAWQEALFVTAVNLHDAVKTAISAPEFFRDISTGEDRPYVGLTKLRSGKRLSRVFEENDISDQGVLRLKLSVTLEKEPNAFPKTSVWFAVGIQFTQGTAHYCIWDADSDDIRSDGLWTSDLGRFVMNLQERITGYLSFDPMDGLGSRPSFGFL